MVEELLNYQAKDASLREIELKLSSSEEGKKAMVARKYLEGVEESVNKLELKAAELVNAYKNTQQELNKLKEQESEFSSAAENVEDINGLDYLIKKTDELIAQIKVLSDTSNKINADIQTVLTEYKTIRAKTKQAQVQYKENIEKYAEYKNSFAEEKKQICEELEKLKKKVNPDLMERYLKKRAGKMYPILYEVKDTVCGACNMQLSMSELNRLKNGEVIDCDQCGRMLYQSQK